jgi:pimeloyl-ACP methyl ester carboxylesterase
VLDPAALDGARADPGDLGRGRHRAGHLLLDGLDELVPDLRIERIPEGSHWVIHEQPQRVNAAIRDFLAGT